jgi:hypothetical protein
MICGLWKIFFLSCLALYSFIFLQDPFKDALNT